MSNADLGGLSIFPSFIIRKASTVRPACDDAWIVCSFRKVELTTLDTGRSFGLRSLLSS